MKINTVVYLVIAALVLVGLFFLLKPKTTPSVTDSTNQDASSPTTPTERTFELVIKDNKLVSGPSTLKVTEGESVVIKITADAPEEFHLHGYDKIADLEKDVAVEIKFTADLTGRFTYELEESKTDIGALEVSPK